MSDGFERAVRDAAATLAESGSPPSYHTSWQRGLRRRLAKRAAVAVLGVGALAAVFVVDTDRIPGRGSGGESDDIAVAASGLPADAGASEGDNEGSQPATDDLGPAPADQSPAVSTATESPQGDSADDGRTGDPFPSATPALETAVPSAEPESTNAAEQAPADGQAPALTATPVPTPRPTPAATATPVPTVTAAASPSSTPLPAFSAPEQTPDPTSTATTGPNAEATSTGPDFTASPTPSSTEIDGPALLPDQGNPPLDARPADAAIIGPGANGAELACTTLPGGAKSTCTLLRSYRCGATGVAEPGYLGVDSDGDGIVDQCIPNVQTYCDLTGDGLGDVPCIIKPTDS